MSVDDHQRRAELCEVRDALRQLLARVDALCATDFAVAAPQAAPPAVPLHPPARTPVSPPVTPPDRALALAACAALANLPRALRALNLHLEPIEAAWCERVPGIIEHCAPADLAQRLTELVTHVDRFGSDHLGVIWGPLHGELQGVRRRLEAALGAGYRLEQAAGPRPNHPGPSLPVNEPVVLATGIVTIDGRELQAARCLHAAPGASNSVRAAWRLLEDLQVLRARGGLLPRADLDNALNEVMEASSLAAEDPSLLRRVLNLHTRLGGSPTGGAGAAAVAQLRSHGMVALPAPVGITWDPARFDPGRYERVAMPGPGPRDLILGVRQLGFVDADGLTVQQCILLVST